MEWQWVNENVILLPVQICYHLHCYIQMFQRKTHPPFPQTYVIFEWKTASLQGQKHHFATLCRKIMIIQFQYATICIFLSHFEAWRFNLFVEKGWVFLWNICIYKCKCINSWLVAILISTKNETATHITQVSQTFCMCMHLIVNNLFKSKTLKMLTLSYSLVHCCTERYRWLLGW